MTLKTVTTTASPHSATLQEVLCTCASAVKKVIKLMNTGIIEEQNVACKNSKDLRIKRKRTEEPLDALGRHFATRPCRTCRPDLLTLQAVVESRSRRKKTRGGLDVFQFAQTVEHDVWEDSEMRQSLQVGLMSFASVIVSLIMLKRTRCGLARLVSDLEVSSRFEQNTRSRDEISSCALPSG
jgi:hypothetical protein